MLDTATGGLCTAHDRTCALAIDRTARPGDPVHFTKVAAGGDGGGGGVAPIEAAPGDNGTLVWQSSSRDTDAASLRLVLGLEARRPGTHAEAKALVPPPEGRPAKPRV